MDLALLASTVAGELHYIARKAGGMAIGQADKHGGKGRCQGAFPEFSLGSQGGWWCHTDGSTEESLLLSCYTSSCPIPSFQSFNPDLFFNGLWGLFQKYQFQHIQGKTHLLQLFCSPLCAELCVNVTPSSLLSKPETVCHF